MKMLDIVKRAGRSLKNAKARTLLTSLAIAVGAFTLTLTLAAGNGVSAYVDRLIANNFDPAALLVGRDPEISNTGTPNTKPREFDENLSTVSFNTGASNSTMQLKQVTAEDIEKLREYDFVERVQPTYSVTARYITSSKTDKRYTVSVDGYNPGQKPRVVSGTLPANNDDIANGTVLLPEAFVKILGFETPEKALGKTVQISVQQPFTSDLLQEYVASLQGGAAAPQPATKTVEYKVAGVTTTSSMSLSFANLPAYLSGDDTSELYEFTNKGTAGFNKFLYVNVRVKGGEDETVTEKAKQQLIKDGFYVQSSKDIQQAVTQIVDIFQALVAVFAVITIIASVFGIVNTMYISVLERTREIGLMKALGMRSRSVAWLFRLEAAWIGFLGGVIGSGLAVLLSVAVNPMLTKQLNLGDGNSILINEPGQIALLIIALIFVAILAGWFPARKAAKLDPIEALRTE